MGGPLVLRSWNAANMFGGDVRCPVAAARHARKMRTVAMTAQGADILLVQPRRPPGLTARTRMWGRRRRERRGDRSAPALQSGHVAMALRNCGRRDLDRRQRRQSIGSPWAGSAAAATNSSRRCGRLNNISCSERCPKPGAIFWASKRCSAPDAVIELVGSQRFSACTSASSLGLAFAATTTTALAAYSGVLCTRIAGRNWTTTAEESSPGARRRLATTGSPAPSERPHEVLGHLGLIARNNSILQTSRFPTTTAPRPRSRPNGCGPPSLHMPQKCPSHTLASSHTCCRHVYTSKYSTREKRVTQCMSSLGE